MENVNTARSTRTHRYSAAKTVRRTATASQCVWQQNHRLVQHKHHQVLQHQVALPIRDPPLSGSALLPPKPFVDFFWILKGKSLPECAIEAYLTDLPENEKLWHGIMERVRHPHEHEKAYTQTKSSHGKRACQPESQRTSGMILESNWQEM